VIRLGITLGDPRGIGPEIVGKALNDPRIAALGASWYVLGPSGTGVAVDDDLGPWAPVAPDALNTEAVVTRAGALAGEAVDGLIPVGALRGRFGERFGQRDSTPRPVPMATDELYEQAMKASLQVLVRAP